VRHVDDICIYADSIALLEKCLTNLQSVCAGLRLELNGLKTNQGEVPDDLEPGWVSHLRPLAANLKSAESLVTFCDRSFFYYKATKDPSLVNYSITATMRFGLQRKYWKIYEAFLLTYLEHEPRSVVKVGECLLRAKTRGYRLDGRSIVRVYKLFISQHARMNHGHEVNQAIWALYKLDLLNRIGPVAWSAVTNMNDNFVAVTVLYLREKGLIPGLRIDKWRSTVRAHDAYSTENWLLCHESKINGWITNTATPTNGFWGKIVGDEVSFVDSLEGERTIGDDSIDGEITPESSDEMVAIAPSG
jgi:hypothetical protein